MPRIPGLEGVRLDVLDDTKWNANRLLRKTGPGSPARRPGRAPEFRHEALRHRDAFGLADLVPAERTRSADEILPPPRIATRRRRRPTAAGETIRRWVLIQPRGKILL
jgi:hypothetical protein